MKQSLRPQAIKYLKERKAHIAKKYGNATCVIDKNSTPIAMKIGWTGQSKTFNAFAKIAPGLFSGAPLSMDFDEDAKTAEVAFNTDEEKVSTFLKGLSSRSTTDAAAGTPRKKKAAVKKTVRKTAKRKRKSVPKKIARKKSVSAMKGPRHRLKKASNQLKAIYMLFEELPAADKNVFLLSYAPKPEQFDPQPVMHHLSKAIALLKKKK
jgi:hypothetical protein